MSRETKTEYDAVHPRFTTPLTSEEIENCVRNNYYYCDTCNLPFAADVKGLRYHFQKEITGHTPYASCFYCGGAVYKYFHQDELKVYHDCPNPKSEEIT